MKKLSTFILFLVAIQPSLATHVIGGEISVKRTSPQSLNYQIKVNLYMDETTGAIASAGQHDVSICVGEKGQILKASRKIKIQIGTNISLNVYDMSYTYAAPGVYTVSVGLENRAGDLVNISANNNAPFHIQTTFVTNIPNSTPTFEQGIDTQAAPLKQVYSYSQKAIDAEGDSLVYRLASIKRGQPEICTGREIESYKYPNEVTKEGTFKINPQTGNVTWIAPTQVGRYAYVVVVEEWREGQKISETYREISMTTEDRGGVPIVIPPYEYLDNGLIMSIDKKRTDELWVYPSPVQKTLKVVLNYRKAQPVHFQIISSTGKVMATQEILESRQMHVHELELGDLPTGVYFIKTLDASSLTIKFVKQ
ncbi:T9SS type A sorting domain-containing protein [Runella sp. MFBS21]|uniref:T9SS type A sorting domain-containing protein n=1 Tax=Runella sp. MFBS21 TaxID=3034018 RepID=UPI0023F943A2|nr:T9SS type A sorting domain-containing protein [Runella sp. MFBS21]MDF7816438.1 T9SS type A sorting domain-containing protein [Runella sp. MFBS21]